MKRSLLLFLGLLCLVLMASPAWARDYTSRECPVVGNTQSRIYHVPGGNFYPRMLRQNQGLDNRRCFTSEAQARAAGFRASKR